MNDQMINRGFFFIRQNFDASFLEFRSTIFFSFAFIKGKKVSLLEVFTERPNCFSRVVKETFETLLITFQVKNCPNVSRPIRRMRMILVFLKPSKRLRILPKNN